jgi:outer membrane protein assembly factor BamB
MIFFSMLTSNRTFPFTRRSTNRAALALGTLLLAPGVTLAQRGTGDWMTAAYDPQRSSWVRSDGKVSPQTMAKPGFDLVWKLQPRNDPRQLNMFTPPALLEFYIGYRGFRALAFFGGSSNRVVAVDVDLGRLEWEKSYEAPTAAGTLPCPGGMTSTVTRPTSTDYPTFFAARGAGRGTPAKSGVGLPDEGAVTIRKTEAPAPRPVRRNAAPAAAGPNPYAPRIQFVLALTGDGKLHSLWVSNGNEPDPGVPFLPPGANALGLIVYDGFAYAATTSGCGGVDNGVWALDLKTRKVSQWKTAESTVYGPAVRPDGSLFVSAGGELDALAPGTLKPLGSYKAAGVAFTSSPVIFDYRGRDLVAVTSNDGRLHLVDAALQGGTALDRSEPFSSADYAVGAITSWRDPAGTRWLLVPAGGSVAVDAGFSAANGDVKEGALVAWKVEDNNGAPALKKGWISRDMKSPLPPVVINGVVFVVASGEARSNDPKMTARQRAQNSRPAVLYALDALTGRELWSSGNSISSFVHSGGLSAGGGRIYVSGYDGMQYAFGFPMEH